MNTIILCEGKIDAVLLGYYIDKVCGFRHTKGKIDKPFTVDLNKENAFFTWHIRGADRLAIWAIGGEGNFKAAIVEFFNAQKKADDSSKYDQFALIRDRDTEMDEQSILNKYSEYFEDTNITLKNNATRIGEYINSFSETKELKTFALVIPKDKLGALETVLLDSIEEDEYDKSIVKKSNVFIKEIRIIADKYIFSDRLELKAKLSTVFAVKMPEKVFTFMDEMLTTTVKWEEKETLRELFKNLVNLFK